MNKSKYNKEYNDRVLRRYSLNLNRAKDKDIIEAITKESPDNIQAGIKELIRKGILLNQIKDQRIIWIKELSESEIRTLKNQFNDTGD